MKIMSVVGARPNFMKAAPIVAAIREHNNCLSAGAANGLGTASSEILHHILVHTGQHYDQLMSGSFFADLELSPPDVHLGVGSGSHAGQTAEIMRKFEEVLVRERPDVLVVVGDVNSTLACALVAAKISFDDAGRRPIIAHVEAGLRSFDRTMPEEINRVLTDQLSDLLFVTEDSGLHNLASEGVPAGRVHFVGNTMIDSLLSYQEKAEASTILDELGLRNSEPGNGSGDSARRYGLLTLHRPANVDSRDTLLNILEGLENLSTQLPVIFPAHPRTQKRIAEFGLEDRFDWSYSRNASAASGTTNRWDAIRVIGPLGYLDFLCLMKHARVVVTDSGGIQEETTCLGVPCVTVRNNTERPVTILEGTNVLAGVKPEGIREAIRLQAQVPNQGTIPAKWDGRSAVRILDVLLRVRDEQLLSMQGAELCAAAGQTQPVT
jgi:UDP-N-acetylglucosamine 2-epimerase (non-hydrolysing)